MYRKLNSPRMDFHATRRILLIRVPSEDYVRSRETAVHGGIEGGCILCCDLDKNQAHAKHLTF